MYQTAIKTYRKINNIRMTLESTVIPTGRDTLCKTDIKAVNR